MNEPIGVIGVPTSAGAFAPGQERAPEALRQAGLLELLSEPGAVVRDHGDGEFWRWRPDRHNRRAQNLGKVVEIVRETANRVTASIEAGELSIVLGGDCTVGIGTVAGHVATGERVGLIYFDSHADLNLPDSTRAGALDWMGMSHMLGDDGALADLVEIGTTAPLLTPEQVLLFGWGPEQAQPHEREAVERLGIEVVRADVVANDPVEAAAQARRYLEPRIDRLLIHFDVDVIDFTDTPMSENPGRNEGLSYADALRALEAVLRSPCLAGLTITELNPAHTEDGSETIERFARDIARGFAQRR